jgi:hypothetical protein
VIAAADLERLREALAHARRMVGDMSDDPLFPRLVALVTNVMPEDREALFSTLEHEIGARLLAQKNGVWSRFAMRVSPFARLYRRPTEPEPKRSLAFHECVLAARVGARMALELPAPPHEPSAATRRVWRGLSSSERAVLVASSLMLAERLRERLAKRCAG